MNKTTLTYDKETCGRCGGTGQHSFNLRHGSVCYGCTGSGQRLTRAGKKVAAAVEAFIAEHFRVPVETLVVSDRVPRHPPGRLARRPHHRGDRARPQQLRHQGVGRQRDGLKDGITLTWDKPVPDQFGANSGLSQAVGGLVTRSLDADRWAEVVAFARTFKKGVTVTETVAA